MPVLVRHHFYTPLVQEQVLCGMYAQAAVPSPHDQIEAVLTSALLQEQRAELLLHDQKERLRQQADGFALIALLDSASLRYGQKGFLFGFVRLLPVRFHICLSLTVRDEEKLRKSPRLILMKQMLCFCL